MTQFYALLIAFTLSACISLLSNKLLAADGTVEIDLLKEFGIEVFETDPKKQAEFEAAKEKERNAALPDFISPETLDADAKLDAIDLDAPKEPKWEPVENEVELSDYDSKECCLRAIRTTRYEVEAQCLNAGKQIWHIQSIPVKEATSESIKSHQLCEIYQTTTTEKASTDNTSTDNASTKTQEQGVGNMEPDDYQCRARSLAKCFDPNLKENALFQ